MKDNIRRLLGPIAAIVTIGWLTIAAADEAMQVDDAKLDSFVVAAQAVHEVIKGSAEQINGVKTDAEADQLREKIDAAVEGAIERTDGITLAEYKQIHQAAQKDPTLENRIIERFNATAQ